VKIYRVISITFDPLFHENVCMITSLPTERILAISFIDGGESQLALQLRHCHPVYSGRRVLVVMVQSPSLDAPDRI